MLVGQISHDLRTPLNSVIILLKLAIQQAKEISENVKTEFLKPAFENSKYLLNLINNILDFTKEEFSKEP